MVRYLNKRNKYYLIVLTMMFSMMEEVIVSLKLEGKQRQKLRAAATYIENVFTEIVGSLEQNQQEALLRTAKHNKLEIIADTSKNYDDEMIQQSRDILYDIVEEAINHRCIGCRMCDKEVEDCRLRQALLQYQVPVAQEEVEKGDCPYKQ